MDHNVTIGAKVKAFRTAKKYTLKPVSYTHLDVYKRQALPTGVFLMAKYKTAA